MQKRPTKARGGTQPHSKQPMEKNAGHVPQLKTQYAYSNFLCMLWQEIKGICDIILYSLKNKQFFYAYTEILQDSVFIYLSELGDVVTETIVK